MPENTRHADVVDFDPVVRELLKGDKIAKSFGKICEPDLVAKLNPAIAAFFASPYMILCSSAAAIGGFLFG